MKLVLTSFAVTLAILSSVCFVSGLDAEDKSLPITIVSHVDIKPDAYMPQAEENSWRLFRAEAAATQQDAGLVSYVVLQQIDATNHFTIVETWRDAKAYEMHVGSKHTVQFRDEIQPFLGSPFDSRIHHQFRLEGNNPKAVLETEPSSKKAHFEKMLCLDFSLECFCS